MAYASIEGYVRTKKESVSVREGALFYRKTAARICLVFEKERRCKLKEK